MGEPNYGPPDPTLTAAGWPRPVIGGWPIPWVAPPASLTEVDASRVHAATRLSLCHVCGTRYDDAPRVYLCVSVENESAEERTDRTSGEDYLALAMDESVMHERCARLAVGTCPHLVALAAAGDLVVYSCAPSDIELWDLDQADEDPALHLGVRCSRGRAEAW